MNCEKLKKLTTGCKVRGNAIFLLSFQDYFCLQIIYANFLEIILLRQLAFWVRNILKAFFQPDRGNQYE